MNLVLILAVETGIIDENRTNKQYLVLFLFLFSWFWFFGKDAGFHAEIRHFL
jgi:hypothetical protein